MEYLVESHLYGYYTSTDDIETIEEYCEECGDHDRVILSYEEGKLIPELGMMLSELKKNESMIKNDYIRGLTKAEEFQNIRYAYYEDMLFIDNLIESEVIDEKDRLALLKRVFLSKRRQLKLFDQVNGEKKENIHKTYKLKK